MTRLRSRCRTRGFALFQLMITLVVFAAFTTVAIKVLRTSMRVSRNVGDESSRAARLDGAVGQLRADVWGAASLSSSDARTLRIERPDEPPVTWTITEQGGLVRTSTVGEESDRQQEWSNVAAGITFQVDGPIVSLLETRVGDESTSPVRTPLVSQLATANGGRP